LNKIFGDGFEQEAVLTHESRPNKLSESCSSCLSREDLETRTMFNHRMHLIDFPKVGARRNVLNCERLFVELTYNPKTHQRAAAAAVMRATSGRFEEIEKKNHGHFLHTGSLCSQGSN
jgi:hypothetical protein